MIISSFSGVPFVVSGRAVKQTIHWPVKQRSKRLHKKLTKRLGPQVAYEPAAYRMADGRMVVHPTIYAQLKQQGYRT
jgi:hypothetical protein